MAADIISISPAITRTAYDKLRSVTHVRANYGGDPTNPKRWAIQVSETGSTGPWRVLWSFWQESHARACAVSMKRRLNAVG
jgi:hypothetical protein